MSEADFPHSSPENLQPGNLQPENLNLTPAQAGISTREAQLVQENAELRQRCRESLQRIHQLEGALMDCQEVMQSQQQQREQQEVLILQATQELASAQDQLTRLFRELEASLQATQRQQILIETLSQQLETSQERIAQIERECALTQQRCNEQTHQALQAEALVKELRVRLQRQQQQTLQFKSALEKCLDLSAAYGEGEKNPASLKDAAQFVAKAKPIQPWSAEPDFLQETASETPVDWVTPLSMASHWELLERSQTEAWDTEAETAAQLNDQPDAAELLAELERITGEPSSTLADDLFAAVMEYVDDEEDSAFPELPIQEVKAEAIPEEIPSPQVVIIDSRFEPVEEPAEQPLPTAESSPEVVLEPVLEQLSWEEEATIPQETKAAESPAATSPEEMNDYLQRRRQEILSQPNWPSPVVYPLRPSKGRKSLSAVELPTFPRLG